MPRPKSPPPSPPREVDADPHSRPVDIDGFPRSTPPPTIDLTDDADSPSQPDEDIDEDNEEDNDEDNDEDIDEDNDEDVDLDKIEEGEADDADVEDDVEEDANSVEDANAEEDDDGEEDANAEEDLDIDEDEAEEEVEVEDDVESEPSVEELDEGYSDAHESEQHVDHEEIAANHDLHDQIDQGEHPDDHPASPVEDDAPQSMNETVHDVNTTNQLDAGNDEEHATHIEDPLVLSDKPPVQHHDEGDTDAGSAVQTAAGANPQQMAAERNTKSDVDVKASAETESVSLDGPRQEGADPRAKGDSTEASLALPDEERPTSGAAAVDKSTPLDGTPHSVDEKEEEEQSHPAQPAVKETREGVNIAERDVEGSANLGEAEKRTAQGPADVAKQPVKSDKESPSPEVHAVDTDESPSTESKVVSGDTTKEEAKESTEIEDSQHKDGKADGSTVSGDVKPPKTTDSPVAMFIDSTGGAGINARPEPSSQTPQDSNTVADADSGSNAGASAGKQFIAERCDEKEKDPTSISVDELAEIQKAEANSGNLKISGDGDATMTPAPESPPKTQSQNERSANLTSPMFGVQPTSRSGPVKFSSPPSFHRPALNPAAKPFIPSSIPQPTEGSSSHQLKQHSAENDAKSGFAVTPRVDKAADSTASSEAPSLKPTLESSEGHKEGLTESLAAPSESPANPAEIAPIPASTEGGQPARGLVTPIQLQQVAKGTETLAKLQGTAERAGSEGAGPAEEEALKKSVDSAQVPQDKSGMVTGTPSQIQCGTAGREMAVSQQQATPADLKTDSTHTVQPELSTITPTPSQLHSHGPQSSAAVQSPTRPQQQALAKEAEVPLDQMQKTPAGALAATDNQSKQKTADTADTAVQKLPGNPAIPKKKPDNSDPSPLPSKAMGTGLTTAKSMAKQSARGRAGVEQTLRRIPAKGTSGGMTYCVENVSVSVKHGAGKPIRRSELCTIELMTIPNGESKMDFSDIRTVPKNVWLSLSSTKDTVKIMKVINKPFIMSITVLGPSKRENGHDSTKYFIHLRQSTFQVFYDACLKFILDFVPEKDRPPVVKFVEPIHQERRISNVAAAASSARKTRVGPPTPHKIDSENQKESQKKLLQQKLAALQKKKAERTAEATSQRVPPGTGMNKDRVAERVSGKSQTEKPLFRPSSPFVASSVTPSGPSHPENRGFRANIPSAIPTAPSRKGGTVIRGHAQAVPHSGSSNAEKPPFRGQVPPATKSGHTRIPVAAQKSSYEPMEISTPNPRSTNPAPATDDAHRASTKVSQAVGKSLGPGSKTLGLLEKAVGSKTQIPGPPVATISTPPRSFGGASMGMQKGLIPPTSPKKRPAFRTEEAGEQATKKARISLPWRRGAGEDGKGAVSIGVSGSSAKEAKGQIAGIGSRPAQLGAGWVGTGVFGSMNTGAAPVVESREMEESATEGGKKRQENEGQRVKELLAIMKELVMETGKEEAREEEGSLERCDVESRVDFLARLHTFKPSTWMQFGKKFGKKHILSAAECARRGWYNSGQGRLRSNEGAEIVARFEECKTMKEWNEEVERVQGLVEGGAGHVLLSGWRKAICSEEVARPEGEDL